MSTLTILDLDDMAGISGGQSQTNSTEGAVKTPGGEASFKNERSVQEPSRYVRCLREVGKQRTLGSRQKDLVGFQQKLCGPLLDKE